MEDSFVKSQSNFMGRTLLTMSAGLLVTFVIAYFAAAQINMIYPIILPAFIAEIAVVFYLSARISKMQVSRARMWFYVYAALNGLTLSLIFTSYSLGSISTVFLITAGMFFISAMIGITTKIDLSAFGQFFMMAVIGLIIMGIVQMFIPMGGLDLLIGLIGIIVFCGLTAYDMQYVKKIHSQNYSISQSDVAKYSILAALRLYLDFINLFFYALRFFRSR